MYSILFNFECGHQRPARPVYTAEEWYKAVKALESWQEMMKHGPTQVRCDECEKSMTLQSATLSSKDFG
jgi:hypothetical protein